MGRTRSNHFGLGQRCQPIKQWASPLFTCNVNGGEEDAEEEEEGGEGGEGRRLTCGGSRCCWRWWRWRDAAAGDDGGVNDDGSHRFFPVFSSRLFFSSLDSLLSIPILLLLSLYSSLLFFFLFSFSSSSVFSFLSLFQLFVLFSTFYVFFSVFHPLFYPPFFFCSLFPCFYRKNRGERGRGDHCAAAPKTARGAHSLLFSPPLGRPRVRGYTSGVMVDVFFMLFGERGREKLVKKSPSSPTSHVQRKKKTHSAVQNGTIWVFFFT